MYTPSILLKAIPELNSECSRLALIFAPKMRLEVDFIALSRLFLLDTAELDAQLGCYHRKNCMLKNGAKHGQIQGALSAGAWAIR